MNAILFVLVLGASPFDIPPPVPGISATSSGVTCFHDADNSVSMCVLTDDAKGEGLYAKNKATDLVTRPFTIQAEQPYPVAGATNTTGGNVVFAPGRGSVNITNADKTLSAGMTSTIVVKYFSGAADVTVVLTEGVAWVGFAAASSEVATANFIAAIEADATLGPLLKAVYTAGTKTAFIGVEPGKAIGFTITNTTATFTKVEGADGQVLFVPGTMATPGIAIIGDADTGIYQTSPNTLSFSAGANRAFYITSAGTNLTGTITGSGNVIVGYRGQAQTIAAETLDTNDCSGVIFNGTNGASFVLPDAAAGNKGCTYTLINTGARTAVGIGFSPNASDNIAGSCGAIVIDGAVDKDLLNTALTHEVGDSVTIVSDGVATWFITSCTGVWAHE